MPKLLSEEDLQDLTSPMLNKRDMAYTIRAYRALCERQRVAVELMGWHDEDECDGCWRKEILALTPEIALEQQEFA